MAPHSSTLAWKIPWTEEPGRLQFVGSLSRTRLKQLSSSSSKEYLLLYMYSTWFFNKGWDLNVNKWGKIFHKVLRNLLITPNVFVQLTL